MGCALHAKQKYLDWNSTNSNLAFSTEKEREREWEWENQLNQQHDSREVENWWDGGDVMRCEPRCWIIIEGTHNMVSSRSTRILIRFLSIAIMRQSTQWCKLNGAAMCGALRASIFCGNQTRRFSRIYDWIMWPQTDFSAPSLSLSLSCFLFLAFLFHFQSDLWSGKWVRSPTVKCFTGEYFIFDDKTAQRATTLMKSKRTIFHCSVSSTHGRLNNKVRKRISHLNLTIIAVQNMVNALLSTSACVRMMSESELQHPASRQPAYECEQIVVNTER